MKIKKIKVKDFDKILIELSPQRQFSIDRTGIMFQTGHKGERNYYLTWKYPERPSFQSGE